MMTMNKATKLVLALSGAALAGAVAPELAVIAAGHAALLAIGVKIVKVLEPQAG